MASNSKKYYDWSSIEESVSHLKSLIDADEWIPDIIVGIANGGVIPATLLAKKFKIPVTTTIVQLRDGDILEIDYCVVEAAASGKKILFVDDINDTGATLNWIKDNWLFDPITWGDQIRTAVIHSKVESAFTVNYKTDIISQDIWIVYPWEC